VIEKLKKVERSAEVFADKFFGNLSSPAENHGFLLRRWRDLEGALRRVAKSRNEQADAAKWKKNFFH
jgi:hypothetical protein